MHLMSVLPSQHLACDLVATEGIEKLVRGKGHFQLG